VVLRLAEDLDLGLGPVTRLADHARGHLGSLLADLLKVHVQALDVFIDFFLVELMHFGLQKGRLCRSFCLLLCFGVIVVSVIVHRVALG